MLTEETDTSSVPPLPCSCLTVSDAPACAVTVTIPEEIADTARLAPKSIVVAVPTIEPLSLTATPEPSPTTPVKPEPSPINVDPVTIPAVIFLTVISGVPIRHLAEVEIQD